MALGLPHEKAKWKSLWPERNLHSAVEIADLHGPKTRKKRDQEGSPKHTEQP